jgi:hypothetical protein
MCSDVGTSGVHALYPGHFDDAHFCLMTFMLHSALVDFRYRPKM